MKESFKVITYNTGKGLFPKVIFEGTKEDCNAYFVANEGYKQGYEIIAVLLID